MTHGQTKINISLRFVLHGLR